MSITLNIVDNIACIKWDDGKANAVNLALIEALNEALDEALAEGSAIVIAGRPGVFCGGFDLKVLKEAEEEEVEHMIDKGGELAERLFSCPKPVVIACTGHAIAQGAALLLASDVRIGADGDFKIGLNETQIGMTLKHFGVTLAKARLAKTAYTRAAVAAELYTPQTAACVGYLDETTAPNAVFDVAMSKAKTLAKLPITTFFENKMLMRSAAIEALKSKRPL